MKKAKKKKLARADRGMVHAVIAAWTARGGQHTLHRLAIAAGLKTPRSIYSIARRGTCTMDTLERLCKVVGMELKEVNGETNDA